MIHDSVPHSLLDYYQRYDKDYYDQEVGRAGQDGEPATCIMFYTYSDHYYMRYLNELNYFRCLLGLVFDH